jgi:hypothetical protein
MVSMAASADTNGVGRFKAETSSGGTSASNVRAQLVESFDPNWAVLVWNIATITLVTSFLTFRDVCRSHHLGTGSIIGT